MLVGFPSHSQSVESHKLIKKMVWEADAGTPLTRSGVSGRRSYKKLSAFKRPFLLKIRFSRPS
jgi:hypothetical protein